MKAKKNESDLFGLSEKHWNELTESAKEQYRVVRPLRRASYAVTHRLVYLDEALAHYAETAVEMGGTYDLCPDFQRGHVWSMEKRIAYMESLLRGTAPTQLRFNSPRFDDLTSPTGDLHPYDFVCVDGLQRLTTAQMFKCGEFRVFDKYTADDLKKGPFMIGRFTFVFEVFAFKTRKELLQFYIDINSGGVVHSEEELGRVRKLLEDA